MARVGHILSIALFTAALVVAADVGITLLDREPLSSIYGSIQQESARADLKRAESGFPTQQDLTAARARARRDARSGQDASIRRAGYGAKSRNAAKARLASALATEYAQSLSEGDPIGRLSAEGMDRENLIVLQGISPGTLQSGPGHYPATSLPGQPGTVAIAGHRTTYLAPFRDIADLAQGDEISLEMPYGRFTYRVSRTEIVTPDRVDVIDDIGRRQLVLTACHPLYSAAERIVVYADLARTQVDVTARRG